MLQMPEELHTTYYKWIDELHEIQSDFEIEHTETKTKIKYIGQETCKEWLIFVAFIKDFVLKYFNQQREIQRQKTNGKAVRYG